MKKLFPQYIPSGRWRTAEEKKWLDGNTWQTIRKQVLLRNNNTCQYCGHRALKYQIVNHINGDSSDHSPENLETVCQMCNLILHAGMGCVVLGVVDLYAETKYSQNKVISVTRTMRFQGSDDEEIIQSLGLKNKMGFKMNHDYLKSLTAFVTSRPPNEHRKKEVRIWHDTNGYLQVGPKFE